MFVKTANLMVNITSHFIFNCSFESWNSANSGQFFAEFGQFQTERFRINLVCINHSSFVGDANGLLRTAGRQHLPPARAKAVSRGKPPERSWGQRLGFPPYYFIAPPAITNGRLKAGSRVLCGDRRAWSREIEVRPGVERFQETRHVRIACYALPITAGVMSFSERSPHCCIANSNSIRSNSSTRSTPAWPKAPRPHM